MTDDTFCAEARQAREMLINEGFVIDDSIADRERLLVLSAECAPFVRKAIREAHLRYLFTFDAEKQSSDCILSICAGIAGHSINQQAEKTVTTIGIATQTLTQTHDYAVLVLLHELAHVLTANMTHDTKMHQYLDYIIAEYNRLNGTQIENDYIDLHA